MKWYLFGFLTSLPFWLLLIKALPKYGLHMNEWKFWTPEFWAD